MKSLRLLCVCTLVLGLTSGTALAAPTIFFGEDLTPGGTVPAGGASETARTSFLSSLVGVGTETFESIPAGTTPPLSLSFPGSSGSIVATLTSGSIYPGGVCDSGSDTVGNIGCNGFGRFPTSGDQWFHTSSDSFVVNFDTPIAAFGFYGTDIGDFQGQLTAQLVGGGTVNFTIPSTIGAPDGSLLFWGFVDPDPANQYTSIIFGNTGSGTDVFGFDDLVVGDIRQVSVPEPTTMLLLGAGLIGLVGFRRKLKR